MLLEGKVAWVTGGSRRLGKVDALSLAEAGADITHAIVFFASGKAKYITGIFLNVSGGIELFTF